MEHGICDPLESPLMFSNNYRMGDLWQLHQAETKSHSDLHRLFVTCISHFCLLSFEQKGHINRSRGQMYRQIAALACFPQWHNLTVASLAKLSCYRCLISPGQGSGRNSPPLVLCPLSSLLCYLLLKSVLHAPTTFSVFLLLLPLLDYCHRSRHCIRVYLTSCLSVLLMRL